jgi:4-diphosphocytidyl-2-C-methyl-D-erythritol kinase
MPLIEQAHAKLNLALCVTGVRDDGYHLLDSIFCRIDLCDTLCVTPSAGSVTLGCSEPALESADNLVVRAAALFARKTGQTVGVHFDLQKRIPSLAGLGGGSADAAAALRILRRIYPGAASDALLFEMAQELGADVPFGLRGGIMRAKGIGETLCEIRCPVQLHFVVLKPEQGLSTPLVFQRFDAEPSVCRQDVDEAERALRDGDLAAFAGHCKNALQPAAQGLCPDIRVLCSRLDDEGAICASMTGSGSAVFGLFESEARAEAAAAKLRVAAPFCVSAKSV